MPVAKKEEKKLSISYWSKEQMNCPICKKKFDREIMRSGNGRMIAGPLTPELHRQFEPSAKFGRVYPLIYEIGCCPHCYSAFFWNDFKEKISNDLADRLYESAMERKEKCNVIFPYFNLKKERTLFDGTAMYYLALMTYDMCPPEFIPTLKKAMICLRLAWLCNDINLQCHGYNYDTVSQMFYRKALFFYQQAIINADKS